MNITRSLLFPLAAAVSLFIAACQKDNSTTTGAVVEEPVCEPVRFSGVAADETYIVLLNTAGASSRSMQSTENVRIASDNLLGRNRISGEQLDVVLNSVNPGFIAHLTREQATRLSTDTDVQLIGQLMPDKTSASQGVRFKAVRMFMYCCAADSRPVATVVEADKMPDFPEMTWIKIIGTPSFPVENGRRVSVLKAEKVEKTDPPEEATLY